MTTKVMFFNYKYVIFIDNHKGRIGFERGVDRIADLEVIPDDT